MKRLWFVNKTYGWGWTPSTWEGWLVILAFVILMVSDATRLGIFVETPPIQNISWFIFDTFILVAILLIIAWKTGEKPEWRWAGKPLKKK